MPSKGQSLTAAYVAWDTSSNTGKTGDGGNHVLRWVKDGTSAAPTNSPSEVDATNAPGVYRLTLTAAECTCDVGVLCGRSSTTNVVIIPVTITFEQLPTAAPGTSNGLPTVDGSNRIAGIQGTVNNLNNLDVPVSSRLSADAYTAPDNSGIAAIKAKTDNLPDDPASNSQVNTRLASSEYTPPPSANEVATATWAAGARTLTAPPPDVALEATLTAIKGAGWSNETLQAIYDAIGLIGGGLSGPGATEVVLTLEDGEGTPLSDALVWVSTDAEGLNVVAGTLVTNALGRVTVMLDDGLTYYRWAKKAGWNFANPQQFTAAAGQLAPFTDGTLAAAPSVSRTRAELIENVRRLIREKTAKEYLDADIIFALNNALAELWEVMGRLAHAGYCTVVSDAVDIVAGQDEYRLPQGMVHVQSVQLRERAGSRNWLDLDPAGVRQQGGYTYMMLQRSIVLSPMPTSGVKEGLRFVGTSEAPKFEGPETQSGLPAVLDQVIEQLAAAQLLLTEGSALAGAFESRARGQLERLLMGLSRRHEGPRQMNYRE